MSNLQDLHMRAKALNLHGLLAHWEEAAAAGWLATLIDWEEQSVRAEAWSAACAPLISDASSRSATSIGPGPNAATAPPSKR